MNEEYLAIVIGPVYKTILQARSTRDLWASSYFFSALMREILKEADKQKVGLLLSPVLLDREMHIHGAGIYPDRAFWKSDGNNTGKMQKIFEAACKEMADISGVPGSLIQQYAFFHAVVCIPEKEQNAILELNKLLDNAELFERVSASSIDFVTALDNQIQELYKDGHQNLVTGGAKVFIDYKCRGGDYFRLPSVIELCTRDLQTKAEYKSLITEPISEKVCTYIKENTVRYERVKGEQEQESGLLMNLKEKYKDDFRLRHKYIAFVYADGDNMGSCIKAIGNKEEGITEFSRQLCGFSHKAAQLIYQYGGLPIFIGGDDLLFALPLASGQEGPAAGRNLLSLISKLDESFPVNALNKLGSSALSPVSLSYGISISYYKYPMADALQAAHAALDRIKHSGKKNRLCFEVQKHSGQLFGAILPKGSCLDYFIEHFVDSAKIFAELNFLASTIHKFREVKILYMDAMENDCLDHFFKNHLNEKVHEKMRRNEKDNYLEHVRVLSKHIYDELKHAETAFETLYACLRFYQFLNQPAHD